MKKSDNVQLLASQAKAVGLPEPEFEHRFHGKRKWRFDLAWPMMLVAVEVHGGVWTRGRHTTGAGFTKDREKMNEACCLGWRVIEVTTGQVKSGEALDWLQRVFAYQAELCNYGGY